MATVQDRAAGAIVGSFVGDAAAVDLHWVYDVKQLKDLVKDGKAEFFGPGHNTFYKAPRGGNSFYAEQTLVLLESLIACEGWNKKDFEDRLYKKVGPGSDFDHAAKLGREPQKSDWPFDGPWADMTIKGFVKNKTEKKEKTGAELDLPDGMYRVAPLAAFYAGKPELRTVVEEMVRVTNENDHSVAGAVALAKMLEAIIQDGADCDSVNKGLEASAGDLKTWYSDIVKAKDKGHCESIAEFGQNCHFPACFKGAAHGILTSSKDLTAAVREDIMAGGDSAGRCNAIGAAIGARVGLSGLPKDLTSKTAVASKVQSLAEQLVALRK